MFDKTQKIYKAFKQMSESLESHRSTFQVFPYLASELPLQVPLILTYDFLLGIILKAQITTFFGYNMAHWSPKKISSFVRVCNKLITTHDFDPATPSEFAWFKRKVCEMLELAPNGTQSTSVWS
eukprot:TRINITY_DN2740_c0_g1_i2.p1 TRINITY_DN2740_c0_g1~~TRINITY_DN2740_c0_g1_i2.p1  ORF type:complete len:124 (-),score=17.83 TRINITY_DN2740_c0_g1_i2:138-509(-)